MEDLARPLLLLGPVELKHRGVQRAYIVVTQVDQPHMAEARLQIEVERLAVALQRRRLQVDSPGEPALKILPYRQRTIPAVPILPDLRKLYRERILGQFLGMEGAEPRPSALAVRATRCVIPGPP
jgi:hypothetical protein